MPRLLCILCLILCLTTSLHAENENKFVEIKGYFHSFSQDGKKLATIPTIPVRTFQIWDTESGKELRTLESRSSGLFSPDGKKFVTCDGDHNSRIVDIESGEEQKIEGNVFRFSPDGKLIVIGKDNNTRILDIDPVRELQKLEGIIRDFSPDEKTVVTIDTNAGIARIWNTESKKELHKFEVGKEYMFGFAFSPDGKKLITTGMGNTFRIWTIPTSENPPAAQPVSPLDLPPDADEEADLDALREKILADERAKELALIEEERKIIPLVDEPETLIPLDPQDRIWITQDRKSVVLLGRVVLREGFLELLACRVRSKEHESILSVRVKPQLVHAALLATNARQGRPAQFTPTFVPASGDRIDITLRWKDNVSGFARETIREAPAQDWIWDMSSPEDAKKPMTTHWVFSGSRTYQDAEGNNRYLADETGELFGLSNFVGSILDVPIESSADNTQLQFGCFTERIPPLDTPVTIIVTPKR